jgi:hypothetical protein
VSSTKKLTTDQRTEAYVAQTGRQELTNKQRKRIKHKENHAKAKR